MRIFLFDEYTDGKIKDICLEEGVVVFDNSTSLDPSVSQSPNFFLNQVDLVIIEITDVTPQIHFILAQAVLANKPTLCLYRKNNPPREVLAYIRQRKTPRPIKTFSYINTDLKNAVTHFIHIYDPTHESHDTKPSIKYTLRLTPHIDRYLEWLSAQQGKTKADLIRFILKKTVAEDLDYTDPEGTE